MKLVPLRVLVATAPSGGEIRLVKYSESDRELCFYHGRLKQEEDAIFWKAKLAAERPGMEMWQKAAGILTAAGWSVEEQE